MIEYIEQWGTVYLMHFGAWVSFAIGATVVKNGLPAVKDIPKILGSAVILGAVVAIFSSHSHAHYLQKIAGHLK